MSFYQQPNASSAAFRVNPAGFGLPANANPADSDPMLRAARYGLANPNAGDQFTASRQAATPSQAASTLPPGAEAAALANNPVLLASILQSLQAPPNDVGFNPVLAQQAMQQLGTPPSGNMPAGLTPEQQAIMQMQPNGQPAPIGSPAAGGLFSNKDKRQARSNNQTPELPAEEAPPKPPPVSPLAPITALGGSAVLAWGTSKTFDWAEGKNPFAAGRWTHEASSPLAKASRGLSHWGPFGWISEQMEAKVTPEYLKEHPGYRQALLMDEFTEPTLWQHRADSRYLKAELDALKTGLDDGQFLTRRQGLRGVEKTAFEFLRDDPDLAMEKLLLKAPKDWSDWHKQAYMGSYLKDNLSALKEPEFKNILDVIKRELPDALEHPSVPNNLLRGLSEQEPKALAWLQGTLEADTELLKEISKTHATGSSALARNFAAHLPTLEQNPNAARMAVFEPFQKKVKAQLTHTVKLDELVDNIKNTQLKAIKAGFGSNGMSKSPTPEAKAALDKALDKLWRYVEHNPHLEKELIKEIGHGGVIHANGLDKALKAIKKQLKTPVAKDKALLDRLDGFFSRTNHTLSSHHRHYYNNVAMLNKINNKPWAWRMEMAKKALAQHGVTDTRVLDKLDVLIRNNDPDWVNQLRRHLPSGSAGMSNAAKDALTDSLVSVDDIVKNAPKVKGLGRLGVGLHTQLKRMFNGDVVNDFFTGSKASTWMKNLAALSMFLLPVMETFKADNTMDKIRSFTREFLGNGIGLFFGASFARMLGGAFNLSPKLLKGASSQILAKVPLLGNLTKGGFLIEFVLGGLVFGTVFSHVGRKISDTILGKPTHIKEKEAYEQRQKAKQEAMKQQALAQALAGQGGLPAGAAASLGQRPNPAAMAPPVMDSRLSPAMIANSGLRSQPQQDAAYLQGLPVIGSDPMSSL